MKPWAMLCYSIWVVVTVLGRLAHDAILKVQGMTQSPWWQVALGPVLLAALLTLVALALRGSLKRAARGVKRSS